MRRIILFVCIAALCGISPSRKILLAGYNPAAEEAFIASQSPTADLNIPASEVEVGPIVHLLMEDNAASTAVVNKANVALNGTLNENTSVISVAGGKIGRALDFNATTSKIDLGSDVIGTGADSACLWFYSDGDNEGGTTGRFVDNGKFMIGPSLTTIRIYLSSDSATFLQTDNGTIAQGGWYHVCGIRDGSGNGSIYINGAFVKSGGIGVAAAGATNTIIGNVNAADRTFNGKLDDLRIYNYALSPAQISAIYNNGVGHQNLASKAKANILTVDAQRRVSSVVGKQGVEFYQSTLASQPALTRLDNRENGFAYSESPNNAIWVKQGVGTGSAPIVTDGYGTNDRGQASHRIQFNLGGGTTTSDISRWYQTLALPIGSTMTFRGRVTAGAATTYLIDFFNVTGYDDITFTSAWTSYSFVTQQVGQVGLMARGGMAPSHSNAADIEISEIQIRWPLADPSYLATTDHAQFRGMRGQALRFDGVDDYLNSLTTTGDVFAAGAKTVFMPYRPNVAGYLLTNASTARFYIYLDATPDANVVNNDGTADAAVTAVAALNKPHVVMGLHENGNLYARVDATPISAPTASGDTAVLTSGLWIGARGDASNWFTGEIQRLTTFNKALSPYARDRISKHLCRQAGASCN